MLFHFNARATLFHNQIFLSQMSTGTRRARLQFDLFFCFCKRPSASDAKKCASSHARTGKQNANSSLAILDLLYSRLSF